MFVAEIRDFLSRLNSRLGQRAVSLRCECENLETVYIVLGDDGCVRVTDDHRTFQYLETAQNSTYLAAEKIPVSAVEAVCRLHGAALMPAPEDGFPSVECIPRADESIVSAVANVATAVDAVFKLAMIPNRQNDQVAE